jgi:DNA-binding CsgD family transcriptional regulator
MPVKRKAKVCKATVEPNGTVVVNGVKVSANRIRFIAFSIGGYDFGGDCQQAMYLSLYTTPPTADQDTAAKVSTRMRWAALKERRADATWYKKNMPTPESASACRDTWGSRQPHLIQADPEDAYIRMESQEEAVKLSQLLLHSLPDKTVQIAVRLMAGQSKVEIAKALGVRQCTISHHLKAMRRRIGNIRAGAES